MLRGIVSPRGTPNTHLHATTTSPPLAPLRGSIPSGARGKGGRRGDVSTSPRTPPRNGYVPRLRSSEACSRRSAPPGQSLSGEGLLKSKGRGIR